MAQIPSAVGRLRATAGLSVREDRAKEVEDFFTENAFPGSERNVAQAVETIRLNSAWLDRDGAKIKQFLAKK